MATLLSSSIALLVVGARGMCPKGFSDTSLFPAEWMIPEWPQDMLPLQASMLRTVTLGGFKMEALNEEFLEGPTNEFLVQGRESYWQASGDYFLYWCKRFRKWRIAGISAFGKNMQGECFAFVSDSVPGRDIRNTSLIKGWIEVENGTWAIRPDAGVSKLGTLGDQISDMTEDEEEETTDQTEEAADAGDASCPSAGGAALTDDPGVAGSEAHKTTSNCPVMPTVRKATKKIRKTAFALSRWIRRLFPTLIGPPSEDSEDEDADDFDESSTEASGEAS